MSKYHLCLSTIKTKERLLHVFPSHNNAQKGLRRESNPGLPHPKREFYHLTTKPSQYMKEGVHFVIELFIRKFLFDYFPLLKQIKTIQNFQIDE